MVKYVQEGHAGRQVLSVMLKSTLSISLLAFPLFTRNYTLIILTLVCTQLHVLKTHSTKSKAYVYMYEKRVYFADFNFQDIAIFL